MKDADGLHKRRGIWHYRVRIAGRWREVSARTRSYRVAQKARRDALRAQEQGRLPNETARWPFEKAMTLWLEARPRYVSRNTCRVERQLAKALVKAFGGRRLGDVTSADIQGYQAARVSRVSPRTVNLEVRIIRAVLRQAKLWARLADGYRPLREDKRGPGRSLTSEEERRLFQAAASDPRWDVVYRAALLAANTAMRGAELRGLRLGDVDLFARTLTVRRAKTPSGARTIPLNAAATKALAWLLDRARLLGATEPEHYLFPASRFRRTEEGGRMGYDPTQPAQGWRSAWRSVTRAAGLPRLRFHDLRHHAITKLAESGVAEQVVLEIAGHVDPEMMRHYSHIRLEAKRRAVAALDTPSEPSSIAAPAASPRVH